MTTSAEQAPSVKSAATAASIIHILVESVFESGGEPRGVRARRTEGIVVCDVCMHTVSHQANDDDD